MTKVVPKVKKLQKERDIEYNPENMYVGTVSNNEENSEFHTNINMIQKSEPEFCS